MLTYVWINPVTDRMYDGDRLDEFLNKHGFLRVYCREDWGSAVRKKYRELTEHMGAASEKEIGPRESGPRENGSREAEVVADVRCPAVEKLLRETDHPGLTVPAIEPILLHCAREISGREELQGSFKVITTPCLALAEAGNRLNLPETEFLPWNVFVRRLGEGLPGRKLESSPIPPGFFGNPEETDVVTGPEAVERYLREERWKGVKMVEFLYCTGGCHGGDGVTGL